MGFFSFQAGFPGYLLRLGFRVSFDQRYDVFQVVSTTGKISWAK
jgi:hypothetical protein